MFEPLFSALTMVLDPVNLLAMVLGVGTGVFFGAIPGLTGAVAITLLLPFTFVLDPLVSLAVIAGLHNGSSYGGAVPAILVGIPGTPGAICTTFDGHPMARQGRGEQALKIAATSSAVGGIVSALALMLIAPPLADVALAFGPPEIFWLCVFGLSSIAVLLSDDPVKGLLASCFGILLSLVGIDQETGAERFTFDILELTSGINLAIIMIGMYAISVTWDIAQAKGDLELQQLDNNSSKKPDHIKNWPWQSIIAGWSRAIPLGVLVGILPGMGGMAAGFIAYNDAKRASKDPDSFGKGNPAGVAIAESANNADNAAVMVPTLTLGIPGSGVAAIIMGALVIHGIQPGPEIFSESPDVVFGFMWALLFTSMLLFVVGGPLATRVFMKVLELPGVILVVLITSVCFVGVYAISGNMFEVYLMLFFGVIGYAFRHLDFPIGPAVLGLVLGVKAEENYDLSMSIGLGNPDIFFKSGISITIAVLVALVFLRPILQRIWALMRKPETDKGQ